MSPLRRHPLPLCPVRAGERGSILILVLALLSILLIVATTLSFTSRLEMAATENFARGVQGRFAAISAIGTAGQLFGETPEATDYLQTWAHLMPGATAPAGFAPAGRLARSSVGQATPAVVSATLGTLRGLGPDPLLGAGSPPAAPSSSGPAVSLLEALRARIPGIGMVQMQIEDESARLNLNAVGALYSDDESVVADSPAHLDLTAFLRAALEEAGLSTAGAPTLARAIVRWRHGADGEPGQAGHDDDGDSGQTEGTEGEENQTWSLESDGRDNDADGVVDEPLEGVDEPDEFQADPRRLPRGDDRHYERVADLLLVPGVSPLIYEALAPPGDGALGQRHTRPERPERRPAGRCQPRGLPRDPRPAEAALPRAPRGAARPVHAQSHRRPRL